MPATQKITPGRLYIGGQWVDAAERATLDTYASAGITRAILRLPSEGRDAVLPLLDQYAKLMR